MVRVRLSRVWRAVLRMGYPLVRWSLQMMTQNGGKTAQLQGDHERCWGSTTKFGGMCAILPGESSASGNGLRLRTAYRGAGALRETHRHPVSGRSIGLPWAQALGRPAA